MRVSPPRPPPLLLACFSQRVQELGVRCEGSGDFDDDVDNNNVDNDNHNDVHIENYDNYDDHNDDADDEARSSCFKSVFTGV